MLMVGPPGSGKSMLAARLPTILPPLAPTELLDVSMIHSIAGLLPNGQLSVARPFRNPHHSASMAAMIGGGMRAKPGEVALAHNGILFLDELPEFSPQVLDSLRQPIESGEAVIARANHRVTYPARFQLIAAMNPCRCGHAGEPGYVCKRGPRCAADYQARISGPLMDRFDLRVEVPAVSATDLMLPPSKEGSAEVGARVRQARKVQKERFSAMGLETVITNAQCPASMIERICEPSGEARTLLAHAAESMALSARGYHRVLKLARTLADLAGREQPGSEEIAEALGYRVSTPSLVA
ncbi:magnesium chelatase family protein [Cohaesibacter marisflavi]|uniref:Magnesium chelatase family protein n=1 Tax=Cohaesibacter marisflavi TaxID=655353 RepID=A0A1I5GQT8_9HYPH|nr:magnesium chelatase family protein [Cohaesibacter marisflavi]